MPVALAVIYMKEGSFGMIIRKNSQDCKLLYWHTELYKHACY